MVKIGKICKNNFSNSQVIMKNKIEANFQIGTNISNKADLISKNQKRCQNMYGTTIQIYAVFSSCDLSPHDHLTESGGSLIRDHASTMY